MADQKIGEVTHYYDKIGVAVVKLTASGLKKGDPIKFVATDGSEFTQIADSMQLEHKEVPTVKKGVQFGLKTDKPVKPKTLIFKAK